MRSFAIGYTLGHAHKELKGAGQEHARVAALGGSMARELSAVGQRLELPALRAHVEELFGFDFAELLAVVGTVNEGSSHKDGAKA